jgi:hypothetical protein
MRTLLRAARRLQRRRFPPVLNDWAIGIRPIIMAMENSAYSAAAAL